MNVSKIVGLALLVVGIGLLYYGWQSHTSVASSVSTAVTGAPTDRSMWLLGLGVVAAVAGLYALIFRGSR
jgi:hypothetical protein